MKTKELIVGLAILATGLTAAATPAAAEERVCRGTIGAVTVDNVRVPQGATCVLAGTEVKGTVTVARDATLRTSGANINGNVQGGGARSVRLLAATEVGGSVQVVQGGVASVRNSTVEGDVLYDDNEQANDVRRSVVGGSVQAFANTGGVAIFANTIDGNLQCKDNVPAPTGGANVVQGNREDQCRTF